MASRKLPGFKLLYDRDPEPGRDFDADGDFCQDDAEFFGGFGTYSNDAEEVDPQVITAQRANIERRTREAAEFEEWKKTLVPLDSPAYAIESEFQPEAVPGAEIIAAMHVGQITSRREARNVATARIILRETRRSANG